MGAKVRNVASTESAKVAAIYRAAAEKCFDTSYWASCFAVNHAAGTFFSRETEEARRYAKLFSPDGKIDTMRPWGLQWDDVTNCRTLALCFMAAMVEAGDA